MDFNFTLLAGKGVTGQPVAAGAFIFQEGDTGEVMYVVKSGSVDIMLGNRLLETVEPGGIFGEMALIDGGARSAGARARTDCEVVPLDQKAFAFMVTETPYFALEVMRTVVNRLRRMNKAL